MTALNRFIGILRRRRTRLLALGLVLIAAGLTAALPAPASAAASPLPPPPPDRSLAFFNIHTQESLAVEYCQDGCLVPEALDKIDHILRDDRVNEVKKIDVRLLDLLYALYKKVGAVGPIQVISGYRSPQTNEWLRQRGGGGVAKNSLHLLGEAIDIRIPGVKLADLRRAALDLKAGGVGYYPSLDFVHVDVGRVRWW
jgi:uncharacterized protein YcbK (DUF882 family)